MSEWSLLTKNDFIYVAKTECLDLLLAKTDIFNRTAFQYIVENYIWFIRNFISNYKTDTLTKVHYWLMLVYCIWSKCNYPDVLYKLKHYLQSDRQAELSLTERQEIKDYLKAMIEEQNRASNLCKGD